MIGHTGGVSGYTACMQMNLTRGFGVIAIANLVEAPLHPCAIVLYAMRVLRAQSVGDPIPAPNPAPDPAHVDRAADYTGTYTSATGAALQVVGRDGAADDDRRGKDDRTLSARARDVLGRRPEVCDVPSGVRPRSRRPGRGDDLRFAVVSERALQGAARVLVSRGVELAGGTLREHVPRLARSSRAS